MPDADVSFIFVIRSNNPLIGSEGYPYSAKTFDEARNVASRLRDERHSARIVLVQTTMVEIDLGEV